MRNASDRRSTLYTPAWCALPVNLLAARATTACTHGLCAAACTALSAKLKFAELLLCSRGERNQRRSMHVRSCDAVAHEDPCAIAKVLLGTQSGMASNFTSFSFPHLHVVELRQNMLADSCAALTAVALELAHTCAQGFKQCSCREAMLAELL